MTTTTASSSSIHDHDIQRILSPSSTDDATATDFNLLNTLNTYFPDEASLAETLSLQEKLSNEQKALQDEIQSLQQQLRESQDSNRMQVIQELISELLGQISRIREKATESEAVVRNITKDIQVLDLAKKNLITSLTTLKRLQMLVNALTQLEDLVHEKKYQEVAQTLSAVKEISAAFRSFVTVPRIAQVWRRVQQIQGEIRTVIESDFDKFYLEDPNRQVKTSTIADACLVVDVLGDDVRSGLVDRYVSMELKEYRRIFRTSDEAGQLDNISRRFSWFLRLLQSHDLHQGRVFPSEWRVNWNLLSKFVEITRDDLSVLLSKAGSSLTVNTLLENLQLSADFEATMTRKWATPFSTILQTAAGPSGPVKSITTAFEPHMGVFVDAQDKALADMLAPHRKGRVAPPRTSLDTSTPRASVEGEDGASPILVLPSSTELFYFYGQSLEQCAKLSSGQALFDLTTLHRKWLKIYADDVLTPSLKKQPPPRRSTESRFDLAAIQQASLVINTADYCQHTAVELEQRIREKINDEFKGRVSFQSECDVFIGCISSAIGIHIRELESACDPYFISMTRTTWATWAQVSGPSTFTTDLMKAVEQVVGAIRPGIEQKKYLRNLYDKVYSVLLAKFTTALVKSRPLGEVGAEQLLIDLQTLKAFLMKLPGEGLMTSSYTRGLAKSTSRLESLLKVIVTPVDPAEGFILNYTLLIGDASFSNFQKILDLKGAPKLTQNDLLDSFLTMTSTKTDLETTSFLTSLDMDPTSAQGGMTSPAIMSTTSEGFFSGLASPPLSGPPTGSSVGEGMRSGDRQVFSDFRRFVSFGLRRDAQAPT